MIEDFLVGWFFGIVAFFAGFFLGAIVYNYPKKKEKAAKE